MLLKMILSLQNRTIFGAGLLHLPGLFVSSRDIPVFTASGKAHNNVPNCSACTSGISVASADGPRKEASEKTLRLHITTFLSLFL